MKGFSAIVRKQDSIMLIQGDLSIGKPDEVFQGRQAYPYWGDENPMPLPPVNKHISIRFHRMRNPEVFTV
jgi:hypothetical protein